MVAFSGLCRSLSRLAKGTPHYTFWKKTSSKYTSIPTVRQSQAVSDGELNMSGRGCGGSCTSLPGTQTVDGQASSVVSWAVCFEKLLEDPVGLRYFTAFLRSEVSAENILFYQACEKFRKIPPNRTKELSEEACSIFHTYLSDNGPYPVNIDDTARVEEKDLHHPTARMFDKAQAQIFKLMKMDSYRRFVRSPLYQKCTLASVEGSPLPSIPSEPTSTRSWENMATASTSLNDIKKKDKDWEKRGSWGVELSNPKNGHFSSRHSDHGQGDGVGVEGGFCCVHLPDGSASLAPTQPGLPLREMLSAICKKRCFPMKDVIIYLQGKEKQPLTMDQDSSVLRDQQVYLELRVTFTLEVLFTGKTVGIMVKSSKTLQDALSTVLQKNQLEFHQALVTMSGSDVPLNMNTNVFSLANKKLQLDKVKVTSPRSSGHSSFPPERASSSVRPEIGVSPPTDRPKPRVRKNPEMEEMIELLSRAQACRVDDQRGLLTKEHLELPQFLLQPPVQDQEEYGQPGECQGVGLHTDTKTPAVTSISTSNPVGEAKQTHQVPNAKTNKKCVCEYTA